MRNRTSTALWLAIILMAVIGIFTIKIMVSYFDLQNENASLQQAVGELSERNDVLKAECNKTEENIKLLEEDNKSLLIENDELNNRISVLELAIATKEEEPIAEPNNYAIITLSDSERDLLAKILALEAGDQPDCGQRAVIEVVFNRILTGWADTVEEVIYQKGQFATVKYLNKPYQTPGEQEYSNIDYVLAHGSTILPPDYVFFATYKANGKDFLQIQDHYFGRGK